MPIATGPAQADGEINECGKEWHTVMIGGYRNGGGGYTALDLTNPKCEEVGGKCDPLIEKFAASTNDGRFNADGPDYPKHLWTVFDRDFGNTWSKAAIGRTRMNTEVSGSSLTVDRWLAFVGGGLDPLDTDPTDGIDFGNAFYAIDVVTGQIVYKFHPTRPIPASPETIPSGTNVLASMTCDMAGEPGVFDLNADGYVDIAYAGDTCGRLWRFDISKPITDKDNNVSDTGRTDTTIGSAEIIAEDWTASIAFCANTDSECGTDSSPTVPQNNVQPIYFSATTAIDDVGQRHVIFSTGSRRDPTSTVEFGKLFNFIDSFVPAFLAGGAGGTAVPATMKLKAISLLDRLLNSYLKQDYRQALQNNSLLRVGVQLITRGNLL